MQEGPCCASCHFYWEEANVFPHLPPHLRAKLELEHAAIRRLGFPPALVDKHGDRELELMRRYCSPELCASVEFDHECLEGMRCSAPGPAAAQ